MITDLTPPDAAPAVAAPICHLPSAICHPIVSRPHFTDADLVAYGALPAELRSEIDAWLTDLCTVTRRAIGAQIAAIARRRGVSVQTARRKFDDLRHHGWRALINRAIAPNTDRRLPAEFVEWYRALVENNGRKSRPAHRVFCALWRQGETIPGLDNSLPRHCLPPGTTYSNLQTLYRPDKTSLTVMRVGLLAAAPYLAKTFTSRFGLWPASHYMIDDLWHDNFVVFGKQPVRVLEFDCIDVLSACKIGWGTQPRIRREDGSMQGLKESQVRMLIAQILFQRGYNSVHGTEWMAEHGTAAITEWLEKLMFDRTGGAVRVRRSGITGEEQAVVGMFPGRGLGNFKFKSPLESLRNLIHNELGAVEAQTGRNVDQRPERLHGTLNYTSDLLKAATLLPPSRAALLRYPMLEYHGQFLPLLMDVYQAINTRDWHELEGWVECGFTTIDYRLAPTADHWLTTQDFSALPPATRTMLIDLVNQPDSPYFRTRRLSPLEVWRSGAPTLKRIPAFVVGEILGPDCSREEEVKSAYFCFENSELSPSPLRYESRVTDSEGRESELSNGSKWQVFSNPFDLDQLFVHDAKGRHIGIAKRDRAISRADIDAIQAHWHRTSQRDKDILTPVRKRHAQWSKEQIELREHNQRVITEAASAETAQTTATRNAFLEIE